MLNASISTWAHLSLHHQHSHMSTQWRQHPVPDCFFLSHFPPLRVKKRKQQYIHPITYQLTSAQGHSGAPIGSGVMPQLQTAHVNSSSLHFINSIPVLTPARPPPPSLSPHALLALSRTLHGPFHQPCYVCNCYILLWFTSPRFPETSVHSHQKEEPTQNELNWGGFCICYLTGKRLSVLAMSLTKDWRQLIQIANQGYYSIVNWN